MPTLEVDGSSLFFALSKQSRPSVALLFVHGSGGDHTSWGEQFSVLRSSFTVAALDLNGHGRSPRREGDALELYTADVQAVMASLGGPVCVVGHSLGGAVVLNLALGKPQNLVAIGLIGSGAKLRVHAKILELLRTRFAEAIDEVMRYAFAPGVRSELVAAARDQMMRNGQAALLRDLTACDVFNVMDRLSEVRIPALVICGQDDQLTPVKFSQYLASNMPQATLRLIEGAGHMVMLEQPEAVNRAVRQFLQGCRARCK